MPYRENNGQWKMSPQTKADLLNLQMIGTDFHYIVRAGKLIKVNIKEILDERPDL